MALKQVFLPSLTTVSDRGIYFSRWSRYIARYISVYYDVDVASFADVLSQRENDHLAWRQDRQRVRVEGHTKMRF